MAIKMDKHTLAFLSGLLQRGGKATLALDSRICMAEVVDGTVEFTSTDRHPSGWTEPIDFRLGDEVVETANAETPAKAKKSTKKAAAKKKK